MMIRRWRRCEAAILLATFWFVSSIGNLDAEPTDAIETIKERVNQYFAAVQSNDIAKAKQLVLEKSRNTFFPQLDSKLVGVRVTEVQIEKDNTAAVVRLLCQVMIPAVMRAVDVPQLQRWKLDSGEWYFDPADPPPSDASIMQKYYYEKQKNKEGKDPSLWDVRFDKETQDFGVAVKGSVVTLRFPFTNQSKQELRVEKTFLHQLMKDVTKTRVIPPGMKGEIVITLDTAPLYRDFEHDILVQFEPIQEMVKLKVQGRVFTAKDLEQYNPATGESGKRK